MNGATLHLSNKQLCNLKKNRPFQLTHDQLISGGSINTNAVDIHVGDGDAKKIQKCVDSGKGYRFKSDVIKGGFILNKY